jgi:hypothetical protein
VPAAAVDNGAGRGELTIADWEGGAVARYDADGDRVVDKTAGFRVVIIILLGMVASSLFAIFLQGVKHDREQQDKEWFKHIDRL